MYLNTCLNPKEDSERAELCRTKAVHMTDFIKGLKIAFRMDLITTDLISLDKWGLKCPGTWFRHSNATIHKTIKIRLLFPLQQRTWNWKICQITSQQAISYQGMYAPLTFFLFLLKTKEIKHCLCTLNFQCKSLKYLRSRF